MMTAGGRGTAFQLNDHEFPPIGKVSGDGLRKPLLKPGGRGTSLMIPSMFTKKSSPSGTTAATVTDTAKEHFSPEIGAQFSNAEQLEHVGDKMPSEKRPVEKIAAQFSNAEKVVPAGEDIPSARLDSFSATSDGSLFDIPEAKSEALLEEWGEEKVEGRGILSGEIGSPAREEYLKRLQEISSSKYQDVSDDDDDDNEEVDEDRKWYMYKVERRINKIIKDVSQENLPDVYAEISRLLEERPLSSRYKNCSEVQHLLKVLIKHAAQNDDFIPLAPPLIKMVAEQEDIEFNQLFGQICQDKCEEYVKLCASEDYLYKYGERFCKLLGRLFALPRQTGQNFFNVIYPIVTDYVEKWTCPEETEADAGDGLQEYILAVQASALKHLITEIARNRLPCDSEVEKELERFLWLMRESILNKKLPRKVNAIYLDSYVEIVNMPAIPVVVNVNPESEEANSQCDADISFESDLSNESVKVTGDEIGSKGMEEQQYDDGDECSDSGPDFVIEDENTVDEEESENNIDDKPLHDSIENTLMGGSASGVKKEEMKKITVGRGRGILTALEKPPRRLYESDNSGNGDVGDNFPDSIRNDDSVDAMNQSSAGCSRSTVQQLGVDKLPFGRGGGATNHQGKPVANVNPMRQSNYDKKNSRSYPAYKTNKNNSYRSDRGNWREHPNNQNNKRNYNRPLNNKYNNRINNNSNNYKHNHSIANDCHQNRQRLHPVNHPKRENQLPANDHHHQRNNRPPLDNQYHPSTTVLRPINHPKREDQLHNESGDVRENKTPVKEFGTVMPKNCLRCNSMDHKTGECDYTEGFFFN